MKKNNLSFVIIFLITLFSFSVKAQNNTTIIVKDKVDENYFKRRVEFKGTLVGFNSESDVKKICSSIASNGSVAKCEVIGTDGNGNYEFVIVVKHPEEFSFYKGLAIKNNITYVQVNGEKKIIADIK